MCTASVTVSAVQHIPSDPATGRLKYRRKRKKEKLEEKANAKEKEKEQEEKRKKTKEKKKKILQLSTAGRLFIVAAIFTEQNSTNIYITERKKWHTYTFYQLSSARTRPF